MLKIDFNNVIVQVTRMDDGRVYGRVLEGGVVGSNKGISCDRELDLSPFTLKDLSAFKIGRRFGIKTYALSFTSSGEDVVGLRDFFNDRINVISKIESIAGLANLEDICHKSDAILVDRGDLSRDVALEKIAFAQHFIQENAMKCDTPVYVATNLLESMITNFKPTRAEIHDIVSTLFFGANGLVLAAETAIGKYPIETVRLVRRVIEEFENQETLSSVDLDYLCSSTTQRLVEPHGGKLIQQHLWGFDKTRLTDMPALDVDDQALSDILQIAEGVFSPVSGFMGIEELGSVLDNYKLLCGVPWTLPILFQINKEESSRLPKMDKLLFAGKEMENFMLLLNLLLRKRCLLC